LRVADGGLIRCEGCAQSFGRRRDQTAVGHGDEPCKRVAEVSIIDFKSRLI
jgi:hypothetical protein